MGRVKLTEDLVKKIKQQRINYGYSMEEMAKLLDINRSTYLRYENLKFTTIDENQLEKILGFLNIDSDSERVDYSNNNLNVQSLNMNYLDDEVLIELRNLATKKELGSQLSRIIKNYFLNYIFEKYDFKISNTIKEVLEEKGNELSKNLNDINKKSYETIRKLEVEYHINFKELLKEKCINEKKKMID